MVESAYDLDTLFGSLSDPTRRDIIQQLSLRSMSVGQVAKNYAVSLAAVAKHLDVLQRAGLIKKNRRGKEQIVTIDPQALASANEYLETYRVMWEQRLDSLDNFLKNNK